MFLQKNSNYKPAFDSRLFLYLCTMQFTYPKKEKLKSKTTIDLLFSEGNSVSKYPLRLVYVENKEENAELIKFGVSVSKKYFKKAVDRNYFNAELMKMGVSVSKKYFKKAVDRNYFKRVLRETYRLNKHLLIDNLEKPYAFMFFYQSKERLSYQEIEEKTIQLFQKFNERQK